MKIPDDLRLSARNGDLNVLVGSGVSRDVGLPSWEALLRGLGSCLSEPAKVRSVERLVQQKRLLDAAELLRADVSAGRLCERLKHLLQHRQKEAPLADAIWSLRPRFVVTTNYDAVLESSLARTTGMVATVLVPGVNVPPLVDQREQVIAKLHGDLSAPESIVLSRGDYFRVMVDVANRFGGIFSEFVRRPTLAVGYSLSDPDLQLMLHWSERNLRAFASPLFLAIPRLEDEDRRLLALLPGVVLIEYDASSGHRAPLLALLGELSRERALGMRRQPSALEVRGAMLARLNTQLRAYVHDARAPLQAAAMQVELLLRGKRLDAPERERLERIREMIDQTASNISSMGELAMAGEGHLAPARWSEARAVLVDDLTSRQYRDVENSLLEANEQEIPVGARLYAVLVRVLVDNALEAQVKQDAATTSLRIATRSIDGREVLFAEVRDQGVGIPTCLADHLFEANVSSKGEGRGLGLYLLKALVEEVGGGVELSSTPGKGTCAAFWVPFASSSAPPSHVGKPEPVGRRMLSDLFVMVVDDEPYALEAVGELLELHGATTVRFGDGEAALEALPRLPRTPDCVVTDLVMPKLSGFDLVRAIRSRWPNVPFLVISGYAYSSVQFAEDARSLGQIAFATKPVSIEDILQRVVDLAATGRLGA